MDLGLPPPFLGFLDRNDRIVNAAPSILELMKVRISQRQMGQPSRTPHRCPDWAQLGYRVADCVDCLGCFAGLGQQPRLPEARYFMYGTSSCAKAMHSSRCALAAAWSLQQI